MNTSLTITIVFLVFVAITYLTLKLWPKTGPMGINLSRVRCPKCNTTLPMIRKPKNKTQAMWGGWTCHKCGREVDKYGNERHAQPNLALRRGGDFSVVVTDSDITRIEMTGEKKSLQWSEITSVFIVAIDELPVGTISWMIHAGETVLEIPTDSTGNKKLLNALQERLPDFDNRALIEAMGMLHGFKKIWQKSALHT